MQAHLLLVLADGEAGEGGLHDEGGDALGALGLIGHGKDHEHIGHIAVGDEDLGAVHHIVVALQLGLGLTLGSVGTGVGLSQSEGADLVTGGQHGQILGLLLLGAVGQDGVAAQAVVGGYDIAGGGALLGQLLDADGAGQRVSTLSAVLLGDAHAHHAQVEQLLDVLAGIEGLGVGLGSDGLHFVLSELSHHLPDQQMLRAQIEIHNAFSFYVNFGKAILICRRDRYHSLSFVLTGRCPVRTLLPAGRHAHRWARQGQRVRGGSTRLRISPQCRRCP